MIWKPSEGTPSLAGAKGDKEDPGTPGLAGAKGDKGDLIVVGAAGAKGGKGYKGDTGATKPPGPAATGTGTTWAHIDHPEWTNRFSWSNVGPFISPTETTNFDITTHNSITPISHQVFNIGKRCSRYNVVHTNFLNCMTSIFDDGVCKTNVLHRIKL